MSYKVKLCICYMNIKWKTYLERFGWLIWQYLVILADQSIVCMSQRGPSVLNFAHRLQHLYKSLLAQCV